MDLNTHIRHLQKEKKKKEETKQTGGQNASQEIKKRKLVDRSNDQNEEEYVQGTDRES